MSAGGAIKALISLVLVGIFLYFTITSIQNYLRASEEVERTRREADKALQEVNQAAQELNEARREYAAEVKQRTAEGCVPKGYTDSGLVNLWSCPVR